MERPAVRIARPRPRSPRAPARRGWRRPSRSASAHLRRIGRVDLEGDGGLGHVRCVDGGAASGVGLGGGPNRPGHGATIAVRTLISKVGYAHDPGAWSGNDSSAVTPKWSLPHTPSTSMSSTREQESTCRVGPCGPEPDQDVVDPPRHRSGHFAAADHGFSALKVKPGSCGCADLPRVVVTRADPVQGPPGRARTACWPRRAGRRSHRGPAPLRARFGVPLDQPHRPRRPAARARTRSRTASSACDGPPGSSPRGVSTETSRVAHQRKSKGATGAPLVDLRHHDHRPSRGQRAADPVTGRMGEPAYVVAGTEQLVDRPTRSDRDLLQGHDVGVQFGQGAGQHRPPAGPVCVGGPEHVHGGDPQSRLVPHGPSQLQMAAAGTSMVTDVTFDVSADAYGRFMGRFSVPLAIVFAGRAGVRAGQRALDVGCGPGALTAELVHRLGPRRSPPSIRPLPSSRRPGPAFPE